MYESLKFKDSYMHQEWLIVDSASAQIRTIERAGQYCMLFPSFKLETAVEYWRAVCVYTQAVRHCVVGSSADCQTFLAQSPYIVYEGEKCKVVGTIHNSNNERIERTACVCIR
jgi:hypothetical protein